jgi:hypothetical protein
MCVRARAHVVSIKFLQYKCTTYIFSDYQNKGYAPGLALSRRGVSVVSQQWLRDLLRHENLLLVLLDDLLVLLSPMVTISANSFSIYMQ